MEAEDKILLFLVVFGAVAFTILCVIFIPLSIQKEKATINLYNAAAKGEASGVIINIGKEK